MNEDCEYGVVQSYYTGEKKNFGFILADAGLPRLFFHVKDFTKASDRIPKQGDRVIFTRGNPTQKGIRVRKVDFDPFLKFGDICHEILGTTTQEGCKYIGGLDPIPDLSDGIRTLGSQAMYHFLKIHRDDVNRFVERVKKWDEANLNAKTVLLYVSDTEYFCSNMLDHDGVPARFKPVITRLPLKITPNERLVDGIIGSPQQFIEFGFGLRGTHKWIPNPNPNFEPEYSGYFKKSE